MSEMSQELTSMHNSIKFMLGRNVYHLVLYRDNLAAQLCAKTNGSNRLRHVVEKDETIMSVNGGYSGCRPNSNWQISLRRLYYH